MSQKAIVPIAIGVIAAGTIIATGGTATPVAAPAAAGAAGGGAAGGGAAAAGGGGLFAGLTSGGAAAGLLGLGTAAQAFGQYQQGQAAADAADYQSTVLKRQATAENAAAQMRAQEIRRQGGYAQSRAMALAGASGGTGGNIPRIISDLAAETELRAQWALSGGENEAIALRSAASSRRGAGRAARLTGNIGAAGSLASGGYTLFDRYG